MRRSSKSMTASSALRAEIVPSRARRRNTWVTSRSKTCGRAGFHCGSRSASRFAGLPVSEGANQWLPRHRERSTRVSFFADYARYIEPEYHRFALTEAFTEFGERGFLSNFLNFGKQLVGERHT